MNQGGWGHFFGKSCILIDELEVVVYWRDRIERLVRLQAEDAKLLG